MKCPYCGGDVILRNSDYVYGNNKKDYGKLWVCVNYPKCSSYVGCHKGTTTPLGRLANQRLRRLRSEAHKQFDVVWKDNIMTRKEAYIWLSKELHIPLSDCHIGMFDIRMCQKVIHLCKKQIRNYKMLEK